MREGILWPSKNTLPHKLFLNFPEAAYFALHAAKGRVGNAQKRVHFPGRVFIKALGVVYQQIIRFPDAARRLLAEAAHGAARANTQMGAQMVTCSKAERSIERG